MRRVRFAEWAQAHKASWTPVAVVSAASLLILAPDIRPGFLLSRDMVFVPRQPVTADTLGLGSQTPRAVPSDLVVAVLGHLIPAQLAQKLVLLALLLAAGIGAAMITPGGRLARSAAGLAYLWTPYVAEHLLLGQWAVLIGYAAVPWIVRACGAVRRSDTGAWPSLVTVLALCSIGGAPAWLMGAMVSVPAMVVPRAGRSRGHLARQAMHLIAVLVVFALPWMLPALLRPQRLSADPLAAAVFAARSDTRLGLLGSVLTGGGSWNAQADPPGRGTLLYASGAVLVLMISLLGIARIIREPWFRPLAISGMLGLAIALSGRFPAIRDSVAQLPAGGLLRDGQRFLTPWLLVAAVGFGAGVADLAHRAARRWGTAQLAFLLVALPVAVLPGLAWGLSNRLEPVEYPAELSDVRRLINSDPRDGAVLVLPFSAYRAFAWNGGRTSLDPVPRMLDRTVISSTALPVIVDGRLLTVKGDDPLADRIGVILARDGPDTATGLARAGVRWVVTDSGAVPSYLAGARRAYSSDRITLAELPGVDARAARDPAKGLTSPTLPVVLGDVVAALLALAAVGRMCYSRVGRMLESRVL